MFKNLFYLILCIIIMLTFACGGNGGGNDVIVPPVIKDKINEVVLYYNNIPKTEYDTLKIEIGKFVELNAKFFDTTKNNKEISLTTSDQAKLFWIKQSDYVYLALQPDKTKCKVSSVMKGTYLITLKTTFTEIPIYKSIWIKAYNIPIANMKINPTFSVINNKSLKKNYSLTAYSSVGLPIDNETFRWYLSDTTIAQYSGIDSSTIRASILGSLDTTIIDYGITWIYASTSLESQTHQVSSEYSTLKVVRQERVVNKVEVSPYFAQILLGTNKQFTAIAYENENSRESVIENAIFEWRLTPKTDSTDINAAGLVQTKNISGEYPFYIFGSIYNTKISTSIENTKNIILRVVDSTAIDKVTITPTDTTVFTNEKPKFIAEAFDSNMVLIENVPFSWTSSNVSIATIDKNGILTIITNGEIELTARAYGKTSDPTKVTIKPTGPTDYNVKYLSGKTKITGIKEYYNPSSITNIPDTLREFYVADTDNNQIKYIQTNSDTSSVIAGKKISDNNNNEADAVYGSTAQFNRPKGIISKNVNEIYVADSDNYQIRKIYKSGVDFMVSIIAGSRSGDSNSNITVEGVSGSLATFGKIRGLAIKDNTLYASDSEHHCIYEISLDSPYKVNLFAGKIDDSGPPSPGDQQKNEAKFWNPTGLAIDTNGNLYVADTNNNCVRVIIGDIVRTVVGDGTPKGNFQDGKPGKLDAPQGIAINLETNILYIADTGNHIIRKVENDYLSTIAGDGIPGNTNDIGVTADEISGDKARFNSPIGITTYKNFIIVADTGNNIIRIIKKIK